MMVNDLNTMEAIVASRNDLCWNGWDVVKYTHNNNAMYSVDGAFRNGKWMKKKVFPLTEKGWDLPSNIGRDHARVEG